MRRVAGADLLSRGAQPRHHRRQRRARRSRRRLAGCLIALERHRPHRRPQRHAREQPVADFVHRPLCDHADARRDHLASTCRVRARRCAGASPRSRARAARSPIRSRSCVIAGTRRSGVGCVLGAPGRADRPDWRLRSSLQTGRTPRMLAPAIAADLGGAFAGAARRLQQRCTPSTILRAVRDMRAT